jgi:hypothetical protein
MDMMDQLFRNKPVLKWEEGDPSLLVEQMMRGDLNEGERELIARIIFGDPPKRQRGTKLSSLKPVAAALIRFWRRDVDGWTDKDSISREIEMKCDVSRTMAQKYLKQIDRPSSKAQAIQRLIFNHEKVNRELLLESDDLEIIELLRRQRETDLKPIPVLLQNPKVLVSYDAEVV